MIARVGLVLAGLAGMAGAAGSAAAQVTPAKEGANDPAPTKPVPSSTKHLSHRGQLEVSLRTSLGLRAIIAYDDADFCGDTDVSAKQGNAPVCTGRAPFSLDFEVGYGLTDKIDLLLETRLGIESDFGTTSSASDGPRMFYLSPGARVFFADAGRSKLFTTGQLVLDFAGYKDTSGDKRGFDLGVRNLNGLWFDIERAYGFMVYAGETLTFGRWLRAELEVGIGVQARFF